MESYIKFLKILYLRKITNSPDLDTGKYAAKFDGTPNVFGVANHQISW